MATGKQVVKEARTKPVAARSPAPDQPLPSPVPVTFQRHLAMAKSATNMASTARVHPT